MKRKILLVSSLGIGTALLISSAFAYQDVQDNDIEKWFRIGNHLQTSGHIMSWTNLYPMWRMRGENMIDEDILNMTYESFLETHNANITQDQFVEMQARVQEREERRAQAEEFRETIQIAIEQNDYEMFQEAIAIDVPNWNLSIIDTEAKFDKFVQMHEYLDDADTIREELWLENKWKMMGKMNSRHTQGEK